MMDEFLKSNRSRLAPYQQDTIQDATNRWESKEVYQKHCFFDVNKNQEILHRGMGTVMYSTARSYLDDKQSIQFRLNMDIEDIVPRPSASITIPFDNADWRMYNRISLWVYPESSGFQNFYMHYSVYNKEGKGILHAPSLTPNTWNHVFFEIPLLDKEAITRFTISPWLSGSPAEAISEVSFYISSMMVEEVEMDDVLGWGVAERISYCHSGYLPNSEKIAFTGISKTNWFELIDSNNQVVYTGKTSLLSNEYGLFHVADFSSFKQEGCYQLRFDERTTEPFWISNNAYMSSVWKSIYFLFQLRCGMDVPGVHSSCHQTHYTMHPDGRLINDSGGWHDAGDVSQFEICTAEIAHALLDVANATKDSLLQEKALEEARWGLNWLLKTHFGDGYRALAVHYSIWRRDYLKGYEALSPSSDYFPKSSAENGPFENFLASAALAVGARTFKEMDPIYAAWCLRIAEADFKHGYDGEEKGIFTKRWGKGPKVQVAGALVHAASELYGITKNSWYQDVAIRYATVIVESQQRTYPNWDRPIRGFFYEDETHHTILSYEHRGHEQTPIVGLIRLLEVVKNVPEVKEWEQTIELYKEFILETSKYIAPYHLLPAQLYIMDKINLERFTIPRNVERNQAIQELGEQIQDGIKLHEGVYLRRFPIAIQRRGFHATLLSKAKAVSAIAKYVNSKELIQVAIHQLEWVLGKNPFSSSTMYGEGNNYHPLYVAYSGQMVGALPVGIKTLAHMDKPYWPVENNAVYKEIWGHTTAKYCWILADVMSIM